MDGPYYTAESLDAQCSVGFLIKRCGVLMTQIAEDRFESQPISFTQWIVLIRLTALTHASPTELSLHLGHDMGALTRVVDELEREGFVRRERSQHDRRAVQIEITPEGRRLALATKSVITDLLNELVAPYSKTETDALVSMLQKLMLHMQEIVRPDPTAELPDAAAERRGGRGGARAARSTTQGTTQQRKLRRKLVP